MRDIKCKEQEQTASNHHYIINDLCTESTKEEHKL
jgi:hypothetical protein